AHGLLAADPRGPLHLAGRHRLTALQQASSTRPLNGRDPRHLDQPFRQTGTRQQLDHKRWLPALSGHEPSIGPTRRSGRGHQRHRPPPSWLVIGA
ncbi:hypothetical protein, partial [Saccharopolyspora shandongensis]|uniref:hypothetical protein n=1 Tax=Saccharopolyspora shandongensis TaxID=418495 RepID=UPI00340918DE